MMNMTSFINRFKQQQLFWLDQLLPLSCLLCHQPCSHPLSLCFACQKLIPLPVGLALMEHTGILTNNETPPWQTLRCLSSYQSPIKELITVGKFQKNLTALKVLGQLLADQISRQNYDSELVLVPVPLHPNRLLERGYNQAHEIALPIAKTLGLSINNNCIIRMQEGKIQHFLSRKQRKDNAQQLFKTVDTVPKKVAVIDDVFTTGATMHSICTCFKLSGVETIEVWIIARTLKGSASWNSLI